MTNYERRIERLEKTSKAILQRRARGRALVIDPYIDVELQIENYIAEIYAAGSDPDLVVVVDPEGKIVARRDELAAQGRDWNPGIIVLQDGL